MIDSFSLRLARYRQWKRYGYLRGYKTACKIIRLVLEELA